MPTYDGICETAGCSHSDVNFEFIVKNWKDDNPACPGCGTRVTRLMCAPNISWAKPMGQYCGESTDGHFVWTTDEATGKKQKHLITTRKEQKDFCKRYNYADPSDLPSAPPANSEGMAANTVGSPGCWI